MLNLWRVLLLASLAIPLSWSAAAQAASIAKCSAKTRRCIIRVDKGIVGDTVNVLNEKAQLVATGWIIKRQGGLAVVSLNRVLLTVKVGYPVIVNVKRRGDEMKWASAFGPTSSIRH